MLTRNLWTIIMSRGLGRKAPKHDWSHYERYSLTPEAIPVRPVPVVVGFGWYSNFNNPVKDSQGRYWIGKGNWGSLLGGHCFCFEPGNELDANGVGVAPSLQDALSWWDFYDQWDSSACTGYGTSRMVSLLNRKRYFAKWLWDQAKAGDEWSDTNPGDNEGSSVNSAMRVLRTKGHVLWNTKYQEFDDIYDNHERSALKPVVSEGISVVRWAKNVDEVHAALKSPANDRMGGVRFLNSWGRSYPHRTWMSDETLQRLIDEDGEVGLVVDR